MNGDAPHPPPELLSPSGESRKASTKHSWRKVDIVVDYNTHREISRKRREARDQEWREERERRSRDGMAYDGRRPRRGGAPPTGRYRGGGNFRGYLVFFNWVKELKRKIVL